MHTIPLCNMMYNKHNIHGTIPGMAQEQHGEFCDAVMPFLAMAMVRKCLQV